MTECTAWASSALSPRKGRARPYPLAWRPAFANPLLGGALLPPQRGHQRRSLARRNRAAGPGPQGSVHQMRDDRRRRPAELERATASREPDRRAMAAAMKEIVLVRLAIDPQTGVVDFAAPFVVIPRRRELRRLQGRGG